MTGYSTTRRFLLGAAPLLLAGAAAAAPAAAKIAKTDVKYQFTPHGAQRCGGCVSFIPGAGAAAPGTCKVVDGPIPPDGWCVLFAPRK